MKRPILILCCIALLSVQFSFAQNLRTTYNFNLGWKLITKDISGAEKPEFNDGDWKQITLPFAWNEDEAFRVPIDSLSTGISWYRKRFQLPAKDQGKKVWLEFEGIRQAGEFYLNGKFIGRHENGITSFGFDISEALNTNGKENILAVRIDNDWKYREKATNSPYQWNDKNFNANYGGITKNVRLHVAGKIYQTLPLLSSLQTTGVYIYAKDFNINARSATIVGSSQIKNEFPTQKTFVFEVEIKDITDQTIKIFKTSGQLASGEIKNFQAEALVNNLNFWSWGYGYLYTVTTRLIIDNNIVDEVHTKTGFRKGEYKNGMVYLNDRILMMKGYAQRSSNEWPAIGLSVPPWLSDYSNKLMVESNANLVRWMHITPWKQDVESCDRVGLIQAMPAGDAEKDVTGTRWDQRKSVMQDAIVYNKNNPSILFYESGNNAISVEHMLEMRAIRDKYDPYGGRAIGSRQMLDIPTAEYGGEMLYINKSATKPLWATEYSRDEGLRKYWDEFSPPFHVDGDGSKEYKSVTDDKVVTRMDAKSYNRNQDSHAIENIKRWNEYHEVRPGTGKRVSSGGVNIIFSDSNTHFRGAENYRRSGEVDPMRITKDGFYAHQVMWDGWVEPKNTGLHIIGHWNYKKDVVKDIYVVSAGEKVELLVNNKSLGFGKRSENFLFTFKNVSWNAGELKAISYDKDNKKLAEKKLITAGAPFALKLTVLKNPTGFKADGADVVLAQVEVVDQKGNRCPTALNMVSFDLEGPAEWRGGIAQGPSNYILSKNLPVEGGVNRVLIRSTTKAGQIKLLANATGLKSAQLNLESLPVIVNNGLATALPSEGLKPNLARGATPQSDTHETVRKFIEIISVDAGANTKDAAKSYDDNELSAWANDGNINTAWIKYTLAKESTVTAVSFKLNGFKSKVYPLRILVDGKEVFNGSSKLSLGYFVANCKPSKGKTVTIQLAGTTVNDENANAGVEVNGKKLDDGIKSSTNSKGTLNIIEAEIYEHL